ncbi:MAG: type I-B CRISPR-associated protein Cas8b1/Cst1, partial [Planctomycetota bacterium]
MSSFHSSQMRLTGNPFVDNGHFAFKTWQGKWLWQASLEEIRDFVETLLQIYSSAPWKKVLSYVFPNSPLTQTQMKNKEQIFSQRLISYIEKANEENSMGDSSFPLCSGCGSRKAQKYSYTKEYRFAYKSEVPLTGSGKMRNFFPAFLDGVTYCGYCLFAIQCSPLLYMRSQYLLLLHSNNPKVIEIWANKAISELRRQLTSSNYKGPYTEDYTNSQNALFRMAEIILQEWEEEVEEGTTQMEVFHFTNYNQGPALEVFRLPSSLFDFLLAIKGQNLSRPWKEVVQRGFQKKGKKDEKKNFEELRKKTKNLVYHRLLQDQPITSFFLDKSTRTPYGNWQVLELYLRKVMQMEKDYLEKVKNLGDRIST